MIEMILLVASGEAAPAKMKIMSKYNFIARNRKTKSKRNTTYGLNDTEPHMYVHIHPLGIIIDSLLIYIIVW
jgi:hypothetical protein